MMWIQFFFDNPHLVNEIRAAFRGARLRVVRRSSRTGMQDLSGDVPALEVPGEPTRKTDYSCGEFNEAFFELLR